MSPHGSSRPRTGRTAPYAVLAYQGLRCSEVLALEWRHVNLYTGVLSVRQATTFGRIKITKSRNSATDVPMAPALVEDPDRVPDATRSRPEERRPAVQEQPRQDAMGRRDPRAALPSATKRLEIPPAGLHAFRHGLATNLFAAGISAPVVRSMMRHGDIKTTLGYTHVDSEDLRQAARASGHMLGQAPKAQPANSESFWPQCERRSTMNFGTASRERR
jgi:integrase